MAVQAPTRLDGFRRRAASRSGVLAALGVALLAITVAGFWPQYYGPLLRGEPLSPLLEHWAFAVHSSASLLWLAAYATQASLVPFGRVGLHRRLGPALAAYGFALIVTNLVAGLAVGAHRVQLDGTEDRGVATAFLTVRDVAMFGGFLLAAVLTRGRPDLHGRLMLLATLSIAFIGLGRLVRNVVSPAQDPWLFIAVCMLPIAIAMVDDVRVRGRVHWVYVLGAMLFFVRLRYANITVGRSEAWRPFGRALLEPFL